MPSEPTVCVSRRAAGRWQRGHPWIYASDVVGRGPASPGIVDVEQRNGMPLGVALWSPQSQIRLRRLDDPGVTIDDAWWTRRIRTAAGRREALAGNPTAFRLVHGEADGLPSLIVDRYGDVLVAQLLSAGLESQRPSVLHALIELFTPRGILLRNDATVRQHEGVVRYLDSPRHGQKTGAFLDQRVNRLLMGERASGSALDVFTYQGHFALHMARQATAVLGIDRSGPALGMARRNATLNDMYHVAWREANAFDELRRLETEGARFDTIVVDPPAFVKSRAALGDGMRGYQEINLRAMRLLATGGSLLTCSCSYHVDLATFVGVLRSAAEDSGRRIALERAVGQAEDHPEVLTIPESGYLKGALLRAVD
jgi:23S rRNA (cytosine1962-C5)-methyltransferase